MPARWGERIRWILGDGVLAAVVAAVAISVVEMAALGWGDANVVAVTLALLAAVGFSIGAVIAAQDWLVSRVSGPWPAAVIRAVGAAPALVFVGWNLFEGARASTLPGARWGHLWVPAIGFAGLVPTIWLAARLIRARVFRLIIAVALLLAGVVAEVGNRRVLRSEYPDVHAFLILVSIAFLTVAILLLVRPGRGQATGSGWLVRTAVGALVVAGLVAAVSWGLTGVDSRWTVATRGTHTRHIARLVRALLDRDGDGFSAVLGGGDCDDGNPAVGPGSLELAGNGIDEDCDGIDPPAVQEKQTESMQEAVVRWRDGDVRARLVDRCQGLNVLVVAVDALRSDVIAQDRDRLPAIASLFAESVVYERAFSPSAGTDVTMATVMTGRYDPFVAIETTLAEAMADSGRTTHLIVPREVLRYAGETLLTRGFDQVDRIINDRDQRDVGRYTTSAETTDRALAALESFGDRPFFLWVHYFDVHEHLQIDVDDAALAAAAGGDITTVADKYRALVRVTDSELARLLAALTNSGLSENTLVVFFSDHGESLGEDPRLPEKHGRYVYNSLIHVPLALRVPGIAPRRVEAAASLIDIPATLTDLLALGVQSLDGWTLAPHLVDGAPPLLLGTRPLVMNESDQWGIISWPHKLMLRPEENLTELYDLSVDFAESDNLADREAVRVAELKALRGRFPILQLDRTRKGRAARDLLARPPEWRRQRSNR